MTNRALICCGDHPRPSRSSTTARNTGATASFAGFGRPARTRAAASARCARYRRTPPLREISRLTVDGDRPNRRASPRTPSPAAVPRLISSRSSTDR
jgi:hypothetical protein